MNKKIMLIISIASIFFLTACSSPTTRLEEGVDNLVVGGNYSPSGCFLVNEETEYRMKVVENTLDINTVGEYIVRYEYTLNEVLYTCERVLFVEDHTPPTIMLLPGIDTIYVGEIHEDAGVEVEDNYYTEGFEIEVASNVDTSVPGSYEITYTVTDLSNNVSTMKRIVHVLQEEE